MTEDYKYLKEINFPADLRKLSESQLQDLSNELRTEMREIKDLLLGIANGR